MARRFAMRCALAGFVLSVIQGQVLLVGLDATLRSALCSLVVMYGLGWTCGAMWQQAFE